MSGGAGEIGLLEVNGTSFCDQTEAEAARGLGRAELAARIAKGAFALVAILDPGLVVLGGTTGRAGGDALAALVAERVGGLSPLPPRSAPARWWATRCFREPS
ncbi:hypothetical protein ACFQX6_42425 [Streptosporangium lutulentum]